MTKVRGENLHNFKLIGNNVFNDEEIENIDRKLDERKHVSFPSNKNVHKILQNKIKSSLKTHSEMKAEEFNRIFNEESKEGDQENRSQIIKDGRSLSENSNENSKEITKNDEITSIKEPPILVKENSLGWNKSKISQKEDSVLIKKSLEIFNEESNNPKNSPKTLVNQNTNVSPKNFDTLYSDQNSKMTEIENNGNHHINVTPKVLLFGKIKYRERRKFY